jgi:glycerol-3-phosphate acyltransferase PlsY
MFITASAIDVSIAVILLIISYLLGSIPFGVVIGKSFDNIDIRQYGSKNIGTTNTYRVLGKKRAIPVLLCDFFKGVIVFIIVSLLQKNNIWKSPIDLTWYCLAGVLGHCYSIFIGFKGGKAVATSLGVCFFTSVTSGIGAVIGFVSTLLITGYVSLSSTIGCLFALAVSIVLYFFGIENPTTILEYFIVKPSLITIILYIILVSLIIIKHRKNYIRLLNGTESCFKNKKTN